MTTPGAPNPRGREVAEETAAPVEVHSPGWPLKLPLDLAFTALLAFALWVPFADGGPALIAAATVSAPVIVGAFGLRIVFQALVVRLEAQGSRARTLVAGAVTAGVAVVAIAAVGGAVGIAPSVFGLLPTAVLVLATTNGASIVRSIEARVGASSRRIFFIGSDHQYSDLAREARHRGDMRLVGRTNLEQGRALPTGAFAEIITAARPTTLVISAEGIRDDALVAVASDLHVRGVRIRTLSDFYERNFSKVPVSDLTKAWFLFDVAEIHRARIYRPLKRCYEGLVAALLLVLVAPLLPALALAIRLSGPGPVLHRSTRVGKDGRIIRLTKFRSMTVSDKSDELWATNQVARITPVGRWMRRYRLDEIPQLWHVLKGDLSLVGPRPEQPQIVEYLRDEIDFYSARHRVRPGLTGWAQVNHGYGGSVQDTIEKLQYEFFYIKRQSLRLDLLVLLATVRTILSGAGR